VAGNPVGSATPAPDDGAGARIVAFLREIGVPVERRPLGTDTALPGVTLDLGTLVVDADDLGHVGDLLHEAGHLALLPPSVRATASGRLDDRWGTEMEAGAICWSVAAAWHLGIDLRVVLHDAGYQGAGARIAATFEAGVYPGLPVLVDAGLARLPRAAPPGEPGFPTMVRWLRTDAAAN
jgi:hypothetical protein